MVGSFGGVLGIDMFLHSAWTKLEIEKVGNEPLGKVSLQCALRAKDA